MKNAKVEGYIESLHFWKPDKIKVWRAVEVK